MLSQPLHLELIPKSPLSSPSPISECWLGPGTRPAAHCSAVLSGSCLPGLDLQAQLLSHLHAGPFRTQDVGTGRGALASEVQSPNLTNGETEVRGKGRTCLRLKPGPDFDVPSSVLDNLLFYFISFYLLLVCTRTCVHARAHV